MIKTILITGSTDGIGKLAAMRLAKEGHHVYLHGRNSRKLADTITEIKDESGNTNLKGFVADFSDLASVKAMVLQVEHDIPKIDVLINNTGIYKVADAFHESKIDVRFVVNYLAPYLLTNALLPLLEKGDSSRIINVSSAAQSPVSLEALAGKENLSEQEAYAQSKLALTMWSFHLAESHKSVGVIAVNPGSLLNTKMVKEAFGHHWSPPDKGANILCEFAVSEKFNRLSGKYFDNDKGTEKGVFAEAQAEAYHSDKVMALMSVTDRLLS